MHVWRHIIEVLLTWGPYGLFFLSLLDSTGLPVVGAVDTLLVAIATDRPGQAYFGALCAVVGSLLGSLILFSIARKGGEVLLAKYISGRSGARLHLWFQRYGLATVFIPAISPLPMPMKIPVFCAGALEVRFVYFVFVVLSARIIRYFSLAYLGERYGHRTGRYLLQHGLAIAGVALGLAVLVTMILRIYQRQRVLHGEAE